MKNKLKQLSHLNEIMVSNFYFLFGTYSFHYIILEKSFMHNKV